MKIKELEIFILGVVAYISVLYAMRPQQVSRAMKIPEQLHNVCIAAIKRSYIPPFDFEYTNVYEKSDGLKRNKIGVDIRLESHELPICSTIINSKVWTLLTTNRLISFEGVGLQEHRLTPLKRWDFGDFKGYSEQSYTKGFLHFVDDTIVPVFVETGRASMVMVNGVMTIYKLL
jgi:hypothetical protein